MPRGTGELPRQPARWIRGRWRGAASHAVCWTLAIGLTVGACHRLDMDREPVLPAGVRLAKLLDSMHVESHWIAGHHVNWRTGNPDGRPVPLEGYHSHCSAFVAAVAAKLGVEILRPPEHTQVLLANAQCEWLENQGRRIGWEAVATPLEAQQLANRGMLVVACTVNPDPTESGHIAIVRPQALTHSRIEREGPQVTQAGIENFRSTSLAEGFRDHPGAWANRAIRFYAHEATP